MGWQMADAQSRGSNGTWLRPVKLLLTLIVSIKVDYTASLRSRP